MSGCESARFRHVDQQWRTAPDLRGGIVAHSVLGQEDAAPPLGGGCVTATRFIASVPSSTLTISVVICSYTMERWEHIVRAVDSVRAQTLVPAEVILVVDYNDELAWHARGAFPGVRVIRNAQTRGLSGARNTGIRAAGGDVIAFLDDDAAASASWLETMVTYYDDPMVHGVGGSATAVWTGGPRPRWLPPEFDWVVGCTYRGQPTRTASVRNLVGCNMSFRREVFDLVGGFSSAIGRIGKTPLGCEETELCIRLNQAVPGAELLYDPAVNVEHWVSPDRREFRYFRDRCYGEGLSKAAVARLVGAGSGLAAERSYVWSVLPRGFLLALLHVLLLRPSGAGRAFSIVFGLLATTVGYVRGSRAIARERTVAQGSPVPARPRLYVSTTQRRAAARTISSLLVTVGCSVLLLGLAVTASRGNSYGLGLALFFAAVMLQFAVGAAVLLRRDLTRRTRLGVVAVVGVMPTVLYRLTDPLLFTGFDEQLHLRTLHDLLEGAPLFSPNPLLQASPHFPGLELLTVALEQAFDLPTMVAATVVVVLCRLVLVVAIYRLAGMITKDARSASLAVLCYAASPQFYFFNSQYAYQTLALTLALTGLLLLARAGRAEQHRRRIATAAFVCFAGTAVTHHLTSWIALAVLLAWTALAARRERPTLAAVTAATTLVVAVQVIPIAVLLRSYFGPMFGAALDQAGALLGGVGSRTLFADSAGVSNPDWERAVLVGYAVICVVVAVATGAVIIRHAVRVRHRLLFVLGLLCMAYPATFTGRLASNLAEICDRATTFAFLPLAIGVAWLLRHRDVSAGPQHRTARTGAHPIVVLALLCAGFLGGLILGNGPDWGRLPGEYLVVADSRSLDAETLAAAQWAGDHLAPGSSVMADRMPATLLSSVGRLWPEAGPRAGVEPATFYFSQTWGKAQTRTAKALGLRYLYVDTRLASSRPHEGWYFYPGETPDERQLTVTELTKFTSVPGIVTVYHHGPVSIYDLSGLGIATPPHDATGSWTSRPWLDIPVGLLIALLTIWRIRGVRRWAGATAEALGGVGAAGTIMATTVLLTGVSIAIGFRPDWRFAVAVALPIGVVMVIPGLRSRTAVVPAARMSSPPRAGLTAAALLAAALFTAGICLAVESARAVDVTQVSRILADVEQGRR
jgi:GT2 family glycosyltransferase